MSNNISNEEASSMIMSKQAALIISVLIMVS